MLVGRSLCLVCVHVVVLCGVAGTVCVKKPAQSCWWFATDVYRTGCVMNDVAQIQQDSGPISQCQELLCFSLRKRKHYPPGNHHASHF